MLDHLPSCTLLPFQEVRDGPYFASFIDRNFSNMFQVSCDPSSNLFIQDEDPIQNSQLAKASMETCGAKFLPIPPRRPDLNSIESIFNFFLHS